MGNIRISKKQLIEEVKSLSSKIVELEEKVAKNESFLDSIKGNEEVYKSLMKVLPDAIYKLSPEGYFTYLSRSINFLGYKPEDLVGEHFSKIIHPEDLPRVSRSIVLADYRGKVTGEEKAPKLFDERRTGSRMTRDLEVRLLPKGARRSGRSAVFVTSIFSSGSINSSGYYNKRIDESDKIFSGTVGIIRDLTYRKRVDEDLQRVKNLETIGVFAGSIAHDFNNIISAILGNIAMAKLDLEKGSPAYDTLLNAERASLRARDLTNQLFTFSSGGSSKREIKQISEVIRDTCSFALSTSKTICRLDLPDDIWPVKIDVGQMTRVINNLIINASQSMDGAGCLYIKAENLQMAEGFDFIKPGRYVKVSIRDEGTGIPGECLDKIFDPYYTTKKEGTGLGLSTCYHILKNHSGYIKVESRVSKGSTFFIFLPAQ